MCITCLYKTNTQFYLIVVLIAVFAFPARTNAQTSVPTLRDSLIQAIEARAQRDAALGRAPASVSDLKDIFGEDASAVKMTLAEALEVYEEAYSAVRQEKPWWYDLQPKAGWIAAAILFVLFLLRDVLKDYVTRFLKWLAEIAYNQLAGYRFFWWIALRRYRQALVQTHQELKIPFRPGRPLRMKELYVPLKVAGSGDRNLIDAYSALGSHSRLMIVGAPGSGKTMLMRHIALTYVREGLHDFHDQPIPIMLELHRLSDPNKTLETHLTEALGRHDFPNAKGFVKAGLKRGMLMLLFDGLDEVNQEARERVVMQVKDLLQTGRGCRMIVTCRTAVYKDEFADWADQHLEIVEFDDRQIQRFLSSWATEMPAGKSVEHLLHSLRERPRIMALARNPLLLTIIAYLYCDTPFVLPYSRAEFYERSTNVLLDQWDQSKQKRNQYKAAQKRLVLQHLALYFQERANTQDQDRRSAALTEVLAEIKKVLPSLNLPDSHAQSILDEIVERSGLLLSLDGGTRYQFTHLTLQEFFTALALEGKAAQLAARFEADPGAWRETIKLWCGLEHDSSDLIKAVAATDPITALECLGDAQQVDSSYAAKLIQSFLSRLGKSDPDQETIERALALVVADPRPRGEAVFSDLVASIANPDAEQKVKLAAARILSHTNLPKAARALAEHAHRNHELRPLLAQMGELVVPSIAQWASAGEIWALDALHAVGTPQAALILAPLLWCQDQATQYKAAWRLGALLADSNVEAALKDFTLSSEQRHAEYMDWVWEPFEPDLAAIVRIIAGRVAHLLQTAPPATYPPVQSLTVDPRLVIPLCIIETKTEKRERWLQFLPVPKRKDLQKRLESEPTRNNWRNILRPVSYSFDKSLQARGIKLGLFTLISLGLWQTVSIVLKASQFFTLDNVFIMLISLALIGGLLALNRIPFEESPNTDITLGFGLSFLVAAPVAGAVVKALGGDATTGSVGISLVCVLITAIPLIGIGGRALGLYKNNFELLWLFPSLLVTCGLFAALGFAVGPLWAALIYAAIGVYYFSVEEQYEVGGDKIIYTALGAVLGPATVVVIYFPTAWLYERWGWSGAWKFWVVWQLWTMGCLTWGARLERKAENPLQGLLEIESAPGVKHRGIGPGRIALSKGFLPFLRKRRG